MKKLLIIPLLILGLNINNLSAQKTMPSAEKLNTVLFGYISNNSDEFFSVIRYIESQNMTVVDYCQEEYLLFVQLNDKNKDYTRLFNDIEKNFTGTCYFKSTENKLILYKKCHDQQVKKNMGGTE